MSAPAARRRRTCVSGACGSASPGSVATTGLDYAVNTRNPGVAITRGGLALGRDVRKGGVVTWAIVVPRCTRTVRIRLYFGRSTPESASGHGLPTPLVTLANLKVRLPRIRPPAWCKPPSG